MEHEKSKPQAAALIKFCFLAPLIIMIFLLASEQNPRGTRGGVGGGGGCLGAEDALTLTSSPERLRPG